MTPSAVETLRRLQNKRGPEAPAERTSRPRPGSGLGPEISAQGGAQDTEARGAFQGLVNRTVDRLSGLYRAGDWERFTQGQRDAIDEAEKQLNAAARARDYEAGQTALEAWENAWTSAIRGTP